MGGGAAGSVFTFLGSFFFDPVSASQAERRLGEGDVATETFACMYMTL